MPLINPAILRWARETAGLTVADAADRLELPPARGLGPSERLAQLESGRVPPTRPMLLRMAKQYRRPLLVFYLQRPPRRGDRGRDFRTLSVTRPASESALLDALIRDIRARQAILKAALSEEEPRRVLSFVGSMPAASVPEALADAIRLELRFSLSEFRARTDVREAFNYLRDVTEASGCFVLLAGNLGSHHTALDVEIFRGFALADEIAPFVVINDQDVPGAWSFTLLHELAHIFLGQTGVSGFSGKLPVERLCNAAAGELLLPLAEIADAQMTTTGPVGQLAETIDGLAKGFRLNPAMVAYRLHLARRLSRARWSAVSDFLRQRWIDAERMRRERGRVEEGGPSFYTVRRHRLGRALLEAVGRLAAEHSLSTTKAAKVLGVKPKQLARVLGAQAGPAEGRGR